MTAIENVVDSFLNIRVEPEYFQIMQMIYRKIIVMQERGYNPATKKYISRSLFAIRDPEELTTLFETFIRGILWTGDETDRLISIFIVIELIDNFARENLIESAYIRFIKDYSRVICKFLRERFPTLESKFEWLQLLVTKSVRFESLI